MERQQHIRNIPGFFYDEVRDRYFPESTTTTVVSSPQHFKCLEPSRKKLKTLNGSVNAYNGLFEFERLRKKGFTNVSEYTSGNFNHYRYGVKVTLSKSWAPILIEQQQRGCHDSLSTTSNHHQNHSTCTTSMVDTTNLFKFKQDRRDPHILHVISGHSNEIGTSLDHPWDIDFNSDGTLCYFVNGPCFGYLKTSAATTNDDNYHFNEEERRFDQTAWTSFYIVDDYGNPTDMKNVRTSLTGNDSPPINNNDVVVTGGPSIYVLDLSNYGQERRRTTESHVNRSRYFNGTVYNHNNILEPTWTANRRFKKSNNNTTCVSFFNETTQTLISGNRKGQILLWDRRDHTTRSSCSIIDMSTIASSSSLAIKQLCCLQHTNKNLILTSSIDGHLFLLDTRRCVNSSSNFLFRHKNLLPASYITEFSPSNPMFYDNTTIQGNFCLSPDETMVAILQGHKPALNIYNIYESSLMGHFYTSSIIGKWGPPFNIPAMCFVNDQNIIAPRRRRRRRGSEALSSVTSLRDIFKQIAFCSSLQNNTFLSTFGSITDKGLILLKDIEDDDDIINNNNSCKSLARNVLHNNKSSHITINSMLNNKLTNHTLLHQSQLRYCCL